MHSRLLSYIVLLLSIVSIGNATQSDLTGDDFIQRLLYCAPFDQEYRTNSIHEHYFRMFTLKGKAAPAESFGDIAKAAELMLEEWLRTTSQMMVTFREEYLNLTTYTTQFVGDRFNPMVNLVWKEVQTEFDNQERFKDWVSENREYRMTFNEFTNLVDAQKSLIEEFDVMDGSLIETWSQNAPNMTGELTIDPKKNFNFMKSETVAYLGLIFMAAFEFTRDEEFYTEDNVLEEYWRVFLPWLEMNQCNRLVNAAFNGMLPKVTTRPVLDKLMSTDIQAMNTDQIKLVFDQAALAEFAKVVPEVAFLQKLNGQWSFFNEKNLNFILSLTEEDGVEERIEFDKIRLENRANCLSFIATLDSFTSMRDVLKKHQLYKVDTYYYFFMEYLNLRIKNPQEFEDQMRATRAIQIIYIFINRILNEDRDIMSKQGPGDNIVHIILRILNGLSPSGNLRELLPSTLLDETTENYIYLLFFIVSESADLPKPPQSDELDRARDNSVVDEDDEPNFKIDPRNPKYAYVIRRLYVLAGNSSTAGMKYVKRYHQKFFNEDLLKNNLIFAMDDQFYQLELAMNKEFTSGDWTFEGAQAKYNQAKQAYFQKAMKGKENIYIKMIAKYFVMELKKFMTLQPPQNSNSKLWKKNKYDEMFLSHLAELRSNFMEMQYVEGILMFCHMAKKPLPDFEFLLANKMVDDDKMNLFEFMKRVISNLKHGRSQNRNILLDTVDINTTIYDDESHVDNGERFHTMLLDVTHFFRPEMTRLIQAGHASSNAKLEYSDLNETMKNLDQQFDLLKREPETVQLRNFRLMMTWNIFDDIEEYLPLLGKFIEETKSDDMNGSNSLKMEMIVENYTNLYIAILEHRLFAGKNNFSFDTPDGRAANLLAYLNYVNSQYENMFQNPLPAREMRFSKLDSRQVQNLIYFLTFRLKTIEEQITQQESQIKLSHVYYPYAFREIYVLIDNHQELKSILDKECEQYMETFENEKNMRATDYTETLFTEEQINEPGFKFCMLIRFNRDMIGLIDSQAENNASKSIMLTVTREAIFQELVVPYYDKLNAHELIIQVFNLNMSHAKAVARESAEKFSNYIALLDAFILILDDLEDGVNDTLNVENMGTGEVSDTLKNFCLELEKTDQESNRQNNLVFIRHMLLEKLLPRFLAPGRNLRDIFEDYTALPVNKANINKYSGRLRYGPIKGSKLIDLNVEGSEIDNELVAMLMIYSPHSEFTADLLYDNNFMSKLPKFLRMAEDNQGYLYKHYPTEKTMDEVFATAYKRKMDTIKQVEEEIDTEVNLSLEDEFDFDLNFGNEEDNVMNQANSMWESEVIEVSQSSIESNIDRVDQVSKILVGEEVMKVELDSQNSDLEGQTVFVDEIIKKNTSQGDEMNELLSNMESSFEDSKMNINGLKVVSNSLDYAENSLESKNFDKIPTRGDQSKTIIQDHNESLMGDFAHQVSEDRLQTQVGSVCKFKISINNVGNASQLEALKNAANKIASQMNVDNYKVNVTSSKVTTSHKLESKMVSHVSQEVRAFDTANKDLHISGSQDTKIKMVKDGVVMPIEISSTKFNGAMNNSAQAKEQITDLINKGITKIVSKSQTYSEPSKTKKVVVKSSSKSSNFLRLV
jgi:hypothetical protein